MKTADRLDAQESTHKATWLTLARWSAWLALVVAAIAIAPPAGLVPHVPGVVRFTLAVFVGLMIVPMNRWQRRKDAARWSIVAAAAAVGVVAMFFIYTASLAARTASYAGTRVVVGSEPTPLATDYRAANPTATVDDLVEDAAGDNELLWTRASIVRNEQALAAQYLALALLVGIAVLATVQVLACGRMTARRPARQKPGPSGAEPRTG